MLTRLITCSLLVSLASQAAANCDVPASLVGKTMINVADPHYSPSNPNAGNLLRLKLDEGRYQLEVLGTEVMSSGDYVYRKYAHDLGQLVMQEVYQGEPVHYTLTLVCETGRRGTFVFSQQSGPIKPDIRQNTGRYTLSH
ncbi:hypothetical protein [Pseudomonas saxonica]|uniref:hypothetical protein n=2 Tax=Pseudomonas TaxID=286 RepID=UPI001F36BE82|nr:hypothetical protein [Pseudomonas saxonica]